MKHKVSSTPVSTPLSCTKDSSLASSSPFVTPAGSISSLESVRTPSLPGDAAKSSPHISSMPKSCQKGDNENMGGEQICFSEEHSYASHYSEQSICVNTCRDSVLSRLTTSTSALQFLVQQSSQRR